ncbi:MAG: hypothetical protein GY857_12900 [Desulfobacula sp.]|nr:hypothetical protein [Desulfobacula sp.]
MKNNFSTREAAMVSYTFLSWILIFSIIFTACGDKGQQDKSKILRKDILKSSLNKLAEKRIFFGHRSVGNNILQGIDDILTQYPGIHLKILKYEAVKRPKDKGIIHAWIDQNGSPQSIADDYTRMVEKIPGKDMDFALIRFTPWYGKTDMDEIFKDYTIAIEQLKQRHPKTVFIHGTFPLNHSKTSFKTWIKKLIGKKEIWEYDGNILANRFNEKLRDNYLGKQPFYNLELIQSTYPDGRRSQFTLDGKKYFNLIKDYTYDNTHLNEKGRQMAAERLLTLLDSIN